MDVVPQNWYKTWFGNEYLTVYAHRDENEARELIRLLHSNLNLSQNSKIIDLCCGQGRHAIRLAEMGYQVIGVDLSRTLLEAAKYLGKGNTAAKFVQADMRLLPFRKKFDLLLNLFTSFGYFETDEQNVSVFREFQKVLKTGACFVFDYMNTEHVRKTLIPCHKEQVDKTRIIQERTIKEGRVQKKITLKSGAEEAVFYESVKMYNPDTIYSMLESADLEIIQVFGNYDGSAFDETSPRLIVFGRTTG